MYEINELLDFLYNLLIFTTKTSGFIVTSIIVEMQSQSVQQIIEYEQAFYEFNELHIYAFANSKHAFPCIQYICVDIHCLYCAYIQSDVLSRGSTDFCIYHEINKFIFIAVSWNLIWKELQVQDLCQEDIATVVINTIVYASIYMNITCAREQFLKQSSCI